MRHLKQSHAWMALIACIFICALWESGEPATITRGYTFSTNELVTSAKLHTLVDSATISGISASDISAGAVGNSQLAANSVTTGKILDGTILGADISARTLNNSLYATGSVDGVAMTNNMAWPASSFLYFTNASTFISFTNATLAFGPNQIPYGALPAGTITNQSVFTSTNLNTHTGSGSALTYTTVAQLSTVGVTGTVTVVGKVSTAATAAIMIRLRDSGSTVFANQDNSLANAGRSSSVVLQDQLTGTSKTYVLETASDTTSVVYTNTFSATTGHPAVSGGLGMTILETR